MPHQTAIETAAHAALLVNLRNAHALEKQVISVIEAQLKLLTDYPELHSRLTEHVVETREQARRIEACVEACGGKTSVFKDTLLSVMGMGQSSMQGFADDAVLKAVTADYMTEHLEIATYRNLIVLADMAGMSSLRPRLEESLREELAMAAWFDQNLEAITGRYVELDAAARQQAAEEERAEEAAQAEAARREAETDLTLWQRLENAKRPGSQTANTTETALETDAPLEDETTPRPPETRT